MFLNRVPARKFRKYECTGQAALDSKMRSNSGASDEEKGHKHHIVGDVETIEKVLGEPKEAGMEAAEIAVNTR